MNYKQLFWQNKWDISILIHALKQCQPVITSTDTLYGLLAPLSADGFDMLCNFKEERSAKPFIILIASVDRLSFFVDTKRISSILLKFIKSCWPGPLTIIFDAKPDLLPFLTSKKRTIALRCPNHAGLQEILPSFDGLFSTSANKSGYVPPRKKSEIDPEILQKVAYLVTDDPSLSKSTWVLLTRSDG